MLDVDWFEHGRGKLHGGTVQGTVLPYQHTAVDADHFVLRESFLQGFFGHLVIDGLVVCGHQDGTVDHEEIGIRGRKPFTVLVINGIRHGQRHELVGLVLQGAERTQLFFHQGQVFIVAVAFVRASHVGDGLSGTEACQRVDMPVRVIAFQVSMVEPQDSLGMQCPQQVLLNVCQIHSFVASGGEQASGCGHDGALPVAFDGAAFEHEVQAVGVFSLQNLLFHQLPVDAVIL